MDKAYDVKALGEMIKAEAKKDGLELTEQAIETIAKASYIGMKKWAKESAVMSENIYDDFIAPFYDRLDVVVLPQIERLDLNGDGK